MKTFDNGAREGERGVRVIVKVLSWFKFDVKKKTVKVLFLYICSVWFEGEEIQDG